MLFKLIVLALLAAVLVSLTSGLVFLLKDGGQTKRTLKALTVRIGLSLVVFLLLVAGYLAGWIHPHGVVP